MQLIILSINMDCVQSGRSFSMETTCACILRLMGTTTLPTDDDLVTVLADRTTLGSWVAWLAAYSGRQVFAPMYEILHERELWEIKFSLPTNCVKL